MTKLNIKMKKNVSIEGLIGRRYVVNTANIGNIYCVIISIEMKQEYIWNIIYSKCYAIVKDYDPNKLYVETKKIIVDELKHKIMAFQFTSFENFDINTIYESIEEDYNAYEGNIKNEKEYREDIKIDIKKIEDRIMHITSISYENIDEDGDEDEDE